METLYVSEYLHIRKITRFGTNWVTTTLTAANPNFFQPNALAVDKAGDLYVTDTGHNVIRSGRPIPSLALTFSQGQAILSWPTWATAYQLEMTLNLTDGIWTSVTNDVSISGDFFFTTNRPGSDAAFYRLRGQ